jgi:hypothetical protein
MKWNYRVCIRPSSGLMTMYIHEVFYDKYGEICHYSKEPIPTWGDDEAELMESLTMQMTAINKSVINLDILDRALRNSRRNKEKRQ